MTAKCCVGFPFFTSFLFFLPCLSPTRFWQTINTEASKSIEQLYLEKITRHVTYVPSELSLCEELLYGSVDSIRCWDGFVYTCTILCNTVHVYTYTMPFKGLFPLPLRVALRGVAWRAIVTSAMKRVKALQRANYRWLSLATQRQATQRAVVMEMP